MGVKVAVALALVGRPVQAEWAIALANMQYPMNCNHATISIKGPDRGANRTRLVEAARSLGCEYLLFLDDDTAPPPDVVSKLVKVLDCDPDVAVCGGIYTSRGDPPYEPMVFTGLGTGPYWRWKYGDIFPCYALGTGCMMIRLSIFDTLPKPWFWDVNDKADGLAEPNLITAGTPIEPIAFTMTDDIYFCHKLQKLGYKILAHGGVLPVHYNPDGSPAVLHLNDFPLRNLDCNVVWYNNILPANYYDGQFFQEHNQDGLPSGWLTLGEAARLAKETADCRVLEFGSYKGRSAVAMATSAKQVICVDTFTGDSATGAVDTLGSFLTNTDPYDNVVPIIAPIHEIEDLFQPKSFDVVYVDADHSKYAAAQHFEFAKKFGHRILAHDWGYFEVKEAAELAQLQPLWVEETLVELIPTSS